MTVSRDPRRDAGVPAPERSRRAIRDRRAWRGALAEALGVTRVARVTGLDRTGVEVASAIRPRGHVLQVTNGKGGAFEDAALGALLEAAELHAAERSVAEAWDSAAALAARLGADAVLAPGALEPDAAERSWDEVRLAWRSGAELASGRPVLVPAHAVHAPPPGAAPLGPALVRWTSNGMGAAPAPDFALLHALLEAVERDRVARALPDGFTEREVRRRMIERGTLGRAAPRAAALAAAIEERGFGVFLFDLSSCWGTSPPAFARRPGTSGPPPLARDPYSRRSRAHSWGPPGGPAQPRPAAPALEAQLHRPTSTRTATSTSASMRDLGLPCAAALIVDHEHGPVPVAAGYACRLGRDAALVAALLEAAQSRATEIHGAREDVALGDRRGGAALRGLCERARPERDARRMPDLRARTPRAGAAAVVARLRRAGLRRAVAVHLEGPPGVTVVKVLVPGLLLSELL
jgi:ribosomal protein S12 methylthiotransferase accessory factor